MNTAQQAILMKYAEAMSKRFDSLDLKLPTRFMFGLLRQIIAEYEKAA